MTSTDRQYFRNMYSTCDDPWDLATSSYERRKYELTLDTLIKERYRNAFEPGCSVGVLSERLAQRCDRLLVSDIIPSALRQATRRLEKFEHVVVEQWAIPESWPDDTFDLVVLSEIAYYFDADTLAEILRHIDRTTQPGAHILGVHWLGATDYPLTGSGAHSLINASASLRPISHRVEKEFVIDLWEHTG